ncbi:MAG TPA: hypothetical protein V6D13_18410 [Halomicronema sp.]
MSQSNGNYNGEKIYQPLQKLSFEEMLLLLDTHPLFTGRCPDCKMPLKVETPEWHCDHCGATQNSAEEERKG